MFTVVDPATVDAFRRGDRDAFGLISRRHFRELHVHCYRMIGSFDEAEELVQDTLLRAWRGRDSYEGRATVRTWLYRIATNVCIDAMRKRRWTPSSDVLPDPSAGEDEQPDAQVVARETIESAFLAAVRVLPAKPRATLILRDVLGFSATETAHLLDDTVPAVNSALQRARATLRRCYGTTDRSRPATAAAASAAERALLQRFIAAYERDDTAAIIELLRPRIGHLLIRDERRRRAQRHRRPR